MRLSDKQKRGSTRAKGHIDITETEADFICKLELDVRKSGISGKGKGKAQTVLFDQNAKPIFTMERGLTVGADISGSNSKKKSRSVKLSRSEYESFAAFAFDVTARNSNGIPDILGLEMLQALKSVFEDPIREISGGKSPAEFIASAASGQEYKLSSGWKIMKR